MDDSNFGYTHTHTHTHTKPMEMRYIPEYWNWHLQPIPKKKPTKV
jgi:hypothetical protein